MCYIKFNNGKLRLDISFSDDDYEKAVVAFKLVSEGLHGVLEQSSVIPVRCLFDMVHLMGMSLRRTAAQYELEVQEMIDKIEQKKYPFKHS